jgi:hypothetical protein
LPSLYITIKQRQTIKTLEIMKNLKNIAVLFLLGITIISCSPSSTAPIPAACSTTGTDFQNIYLTTLSSNSTYDDYTSMDLVTHEYTFNMFANKTVCKIGYQGNATLYASSIPYTIEIYDVTAANMVYSGNHVFNSVATDYVTPSSTINLLSGHTYTIRRIASNYLGNISNTIGRICRFNSAPLPSAANLTGSFMAITGSDFYGTGGPIPNFGIPYIDISFQ